MRVKELLEVVGSYPSKEIPGNQQSSLQINRLQSLEGSMSSPAVVECLHTPSLHTRFPSQSCKSAMPSTLAGLYKAYHLTAEQRHHGGVLT